MKASITETVAHQIWTILSDTCGANPDPDAWGQRASFVSCAINQEEYQRWIEWRFGGSLGFGGKVWNNGNFYVTCYSEDRTPERDAMIDAANIRLSALYHAK